jgi:hypothetical protein
LARDLLPALGPDWGVAVLPARDAKDVPKVIAGVALDPKAKIKDRPADQTISKVAHLVFGYLVVDHNRTNDKDKQLELAKTAHQGVDIISLRNPSVFPSGFEPAFTIKDSFMLLATSPEAIHRFAKQPNKTPGDEALLAKLSVTRLADQLRLRKKIVVANIAESQHVAPAEAAQRFASVLELLDLLDLATLHAHTGDGQACLRLRISPRDPR